MSTTTQKLEADLARAKDAARDVLDTAEREQRPLTSGEREFVNEQIKTVERLRADIDADEALQKKVADLSGPSKGGSLFERFKSAGWQPGKRVTVDSKGVSMPAGVADDAFQTRVQGAPLGADQRFLSPVFPSVPTGAALGIDVVRQASRTLPAPGVVQRDPLSTAPKAAVDSGLELAHVPQGQLAAVSTNNPNALLAQPGVRAIVDVDLLLTIARAEDDAIMDPILAANPATAGGAGDFTSQIVFAAADMADDGYNGSVVALNPIDYAELALLRGEAQQFARSDPLAGFRFVQTNSVAENAPLLIDPAAAGRKYEGAFSLASFEENDGTTNTSTIRLEKLFTFAVERVAAIRRIGNPV